MTIPDVHCAAMNCARPVHSTMLCDDCLADLVRIINNTDWIIDQLRNSHTRQQRFFKTTGARATTETPVPFNDRAHHTQADYTAVITRWQERLADHLGLPVRYLNPIAAAAWMWTAIDTRGIAKFIDAGHMLRDLESVHREALTVINKAPERWFAGKCSAAYLEGQECPQDLYADNLTGTITCSLCGTHHDIANRRHALFEAAKEVSATATEAARAIVVWTDYLRGENKLVRRIGMWAARGQIEQRGTIRQDGKDRPLYRIGDIQALLAADLDNTKAKTA